MPQKHALGMLAAFAMAQAGVAMAAPQGQPAKPPAIRYCTNCATVAEVLRKQGADAKQVRLVIVLSNGTRKTLDYDNDPGLRVGDQVKLENGVLTLDL